MKVSVTYINYINKIVGSCKNTADILINEFKKRKGSSFKSPISRSDSISKEKINLFKKPKTPDYQTRLKLEKLKHKDFKAMTMRSTPKRTKVSVEVTKSIKKRQEEKREREEKAKIDKEEKLKKDKDDKIKEMKAFRERQKEKEDRIREEKALKEKEKKEKEEKEKKDQEEKAKKKKEEKERKAAEKKEKAEHDKIEKERYMKSKLLKAQMMLEAKKNENKDKEKNNKESKDNNKNKQSQEKNINKGDKEISILEKINCKPLNVDDNNNNSNDEQIEPVKEIIEKSIKQNEVSTA